MNQMSGGQKPSFTRKQGQYLAFIDAYTRVNLRPPAEADIQRRFRRHAAFRPSDGSYAGERRTDPAPTRRATQHRGARAAQAPTCLGNAEPTNQNLCAEVLGPVRHI
jgi:hypothetical protein